VAASDAFRLALPHTKTGRHSRPVFSSSLQAEGEILQRGDSSPRFDYAPSSTWQQTDFMCQFDPFEVPFSG